MERQTVNKNKAGKRKILFYHFWPHFGSPLEAFWEPKGLQKSSNILDAILEAKKGAPRIFWGRPGGMRGGPGRDYGGVRTQNPGKENLAKNLGLGK